MPEYGVPDAKLDLVLDRVVDVSPEMVWEAWTKPEHLRHWFVPKPWGVADCEIDLRPGGRFRVVMRSPEGMEFPNTGCYIEVVSGSKLVWTNVLLPGYRPAGLSEELRFTAILTISAEGAGTRYVATVVHGDEESRSRHEAMGFHSGWGKALEQLVEYIKSLNTH